MSAARAGLAILTIFTASTLILRVQGDYQFPPEFLIGFASASYGIEGGWNADGKGESIWDKLTHEAGSPIIDYSTGDIAADSYVRYKEDVKLLRDMGAQIYKFSLSWSRILPQGELVDINKPGLDYYNHLIDELLANGVQPMVTLYHWDLPQRLQDLGGWTNPIIADYFTDFANLAFATYGDRVKWWVTFHDPLHICAGGYGGRLAAPALYLHGTGEYLCGHTILQAHARVYHSYQDNYKQTQKGAIGISISSNWNEPLTADKLNQEAADTADQFLIDWFAHPIFSTEGDYPVKMKHFIEENSFAEGRKRSRLPIFDNKTIEFIKGTADFYGLDHFTTFYVQPTATPLGPQPSWFRDCRVSWTQDDTWPDSAISWLKVVPWGLRKAVNRVREKYNNTKVFITGNGFSDRGGILDFDRVDYFTSYLNKTLEAMFEDGCSNVVGYTAWSFLDSFQWYDGYSKRFGICNVDFTNPHRTRSAKSSAEFFQKVISSRKVPDNLII